MGKEGRPTKLIDAQRMAVYMQNLWCEEGKFVDRVIVCGSVRRQRPVVSDVDMLIVPTVETKTLAEMSPLQDSEFWRATSKQGWAETFDIRSEFWLCPEDAVGPMMAFLTGPVELNVYMRQRAQRLGGKLSQYGLFNDQGERMDAIAPGDEVQAESNVFAALDMAWIAPEERDEWNAFVH